MNGSSPLIDALLTVATLAIFICGLAFVLYRAIVWARQRAKRAYVIAAALAPFMGLGNVADPDFRIVQEAKRLKSREDDDPGDPPNPDEDVVLTAATAASAAKTPRARNREASTANSAARRTRPVLVWVVAVALGLSALLAALVLSWLLLSTPSALPLEARAVRESLSALDWAPLYLMSAALLASMVMFFRLHKSSINLFLAYLAGGVLFTILLTVAAEPKPYFDLRVTIGAGLPLAIGVLVYMLRLKRRAILA
jgi:hypothetical protein